MAVDAPFATALVKLGENREDVVVLAADLAHYTDVQPFADAFPDRFFQIGMAEQNLMGVAAGLAKSGYVPVITTYCVFASRRAYEQVALALCTGTRPAVIAAFLPGITTPFRATHQGTDDLSLMRNIPGLTVLDPADSTELAGALPRRRRGRRNGVPPRAPGARVDALRSSRSPLRNRSGV